MTRHRRFDYLYVVMADSGPANMLLEERVRWVDEIDGINKSRYSLAPHFVWYSRFDLGVHVPVYLGANLVPSTFDPLPIE